MELKYLPTTTNCLQYGHGPSARQNEILSFIWQLAKKRPRHTASSDEIRGIIIAGRISRGLVWILGGEMLVPRPASPLELATCRSASQPSSSTPFICSEIRTRVWGPSDPGLKAASSAITFQGPFVSNEDPSPALLYGSALCLRMRNFFVARHRLAISCSEMAISKLRQD